MDGVTGKGGSCERMSQQQLTTILDQQLQCASDFGQHLSTVIAKFEQELEDWRASIACLQGGHFPPSARQLRQSATHVSKTGACKLAVPTSPRHEEEHSPLKGTIRTVKITRKRSKNLEQSSVGKVVTNSACHNDVVPGLPPDLPHNNCKQLKASPETSMTAASCLVLPSFQPRLWDAWTAQSQLDRLQSGIRCQAHIRFEGEHDDDGVSSSCLDRFVIDPSSPARYHLDVLSLAVLMFDIVTFPLAVFDFDETDFAGHFRFATTVYWTIDMFLSLFSGYQLANGGLEMRFRKTSRRCLKTKAPFDSCIVALDWWLYILDTTKAFASAARITKTARLMRLARILRAIRSVKLFALIERMKAWPLYNSIFSLMNVTRLILNLLFINHFLACGWYGVGRFTSGLDKTWIREYVDPNDSMFQRYLFSYHWAIAQFTPCPINIHPTNIFERFYSVLLLPFGLVIFATLLGNVTAIVNTARKTHYDNLKASFNLRRFLETNKVSVNLSIRIEHCIKASRSSTKRVLESDVMSLKALPSSLRQELHFEIHGPILKWHPFFQLLEKHSVDTLVHICHAATLLDTCAKGHEIFHYRSQAKSMFLVLSGEMEYTAGRDFHNPNKVVIKEGGWLCETSLWIAWEHRGFLVSEQSDLVIINTEKFRKAAAAHASSLPLLQRYAQLFAQTLAQDADNDNIDDLWGTRYGRSVDMFKDAETLQAILDKD